jgi:hypothetical protein
VIVLGPGQGTFLQVCIAKKACDKHWRTPKEVAEPTQPTAEELKRAAERRAQEEQLAAERAEREKWQRDLRIPAVRLLASRAVSLKWTPALFKLLRHNMRVGEVFDEIVGAPGTIPVARYPYAIAVALAFGFSWRPEDLVGLSKRLRVPLKASELTEESLIATAAPAAPTAPSVGRPPKVKNTRGKGKRRK